MVLDRTRIINICDRTAIFSLYAIALVFPVSKALIEILSTLAIVCYIIKKIIQREGITKTPLNLPIALYVVFCLLSLFISSNPQISARNFLGKAIQDILFFFVVVDAFNSERRIRNFLYVLFFSSAVLGVDGIYQSFTHKDFLRHRPVIFINRVYATFPSPNDFGCYLNIVIPFLIAVFFVKPQTRRSRLVLSALFVLLFTCLLMTVSRGAWFAFMASTLFIGLWVYPVGMFLLLLSFFMVITQPFYPPLIKERLSNLVPVFNPNLAGDVGGLERQIFWQAGWKMFISRPLFGVGLGTFMFNFKSFVAETYKYGPAYAHNCYLQMLAELGVTGFLSFLSVLVTFFYSSIKAIFRKRDTFCWYILLASIAGLLGYCVQMAVDTIFYSLDLGMMFWVLFGIGVAAMKNIKLETVTPK